MEVRFACIWFRHLTTNWLTLRRPALQNTVFVFTAPVHGRVLITAASAAAEKEGICVGMPLADAKAIVPDLQAFNDKPGREEQLLRAIGKWCIRYTPCVAFQQPDSLILDISGCAHLWGGETAYLKEILGRLRSMGYDVRMAIADTIGAAWAMAHYGPPNVVVEHRQQLRVLLSLPPSALRLEDQVLQKMHKLGLHQISSFIQMPRSVLRRRFGEGLLLRIAQAIGQEDEFIPYLEVQAPYHERLPCLEPIRTATGIEIAIRKLLEALCKRLAEEGMGIRSAVLKCYRIDGKLVQTEIGTNSPTHHTSHLFQLFELKIATIAPALGIELFTLDATKTEEIPPVQEAFWNEKSGLNDKHLTELLDRLSVKLGGNIIHRYLPDEHFWPERSIKKAVSIQEKPATDWQNQRPRPTQLLGSPERIEVTAPIPDYPPMLFIYKGKKHPVSRADGPERIEREWWLEKGEHRDYYCVEDEEGQRYWLFRSGHYSGEQSQWFIHGFFA
jgi:protein ImuB